MRVHPSRVMWFVLLLLVIEAVWLAYHSPDTVFAQRNPSNAATGKNITSATTTVVKATQGVVRRVVIQTLVGGATIKLYDIASAGCTGTPASGLFGIITLPATITTANPFSLDYYGTAFSAGLCVVTSGSTDILVVYE